MIKKIILFLTLTIIVTSCEKSTIYKYTFICSKESPVVKSEDIYHEDQEYGKSITVYCNMKKILVIKPKYKNELAKISIFKDDDALVVPIYSLYLCGRGSLTEQPKPFEDINGDGKPDLVCVDRQEGFQNHGSRVLAIRIFSFDKDRVIDSNPIFIKAGEILHFDDFNKDGILELVNTEDTATPKRDAKNIPISSDILVWNKKRRKYVPNN